MKRCLMPGSFNHSKGFSKKRYKVKELIMRRYKNSIINTHLLFSSNAIRQRMNEAIKYRGSKRCAGTRTEAVDNKNKRIFEGDK